MSEKSPEVIQKSNIARAIDYITLEEIPDQDNLDKIYKYWREQFQGNTEKVLKEMNQFMAAIKGMDANNQKKFEKIASEIATIINEKCTHNFIEANKSSLTQEKIRNEMESIRTNALGFLPSTPPDTFNKLFLTITEVLSHAPQQKPADITPTVELPAGKVNHGAEVPTLSVGSVGASTPGKHILTSFGTGAASRVANTITSATVTVTSDIKNLSELRNRIDSFKTQHPQLQNIEFSSDPNSNTAASLKDTAKKEIVAHVNMMQDKVQYKLTTFAFSQDATSNPAKAAPDALVSAIIIAASTGRLLTLSGGNEAQALKICAAVKAASEKIGKIDFVVNTTDPNVFSAVQEHFSDFLPKHLGQPTPLQSDKERPKRDTGP